MTPRYLRIPKGKVYLGVSRYQDWELLHSRLNKDVKQIIQIQILETLGQFLKILFLFSYILSSLGQWHRCCEDSDSWSSCSNWSHSLFLQPAAAAAAHTLSAAAERKEGEGTQEQQQQQHQDNLQVIDHTAAAAAGARSPCLPSFPKTFSTPSDQSSIWLESTDGQISQWKKILPFWKCLWQQLQIVWQQLQIVRMTAAYLHHSPVFSNQQSLRCSDEFGAFKAGKWHIECDTSKWAGHWQQHNTCQTRPEIHSDAFEIQRW